MPRSTKLVGAAKRASALKMQRYRKRLRTADLRPVQMPNTRSPAFKKAVRAQSLRAARQPAEREALDFLDAALADIEGWEA